MSNTSWMVYGEKCGRRADERWVTFLCYIKFSKSTNHKNNKGRKEAKKSGDTSEQKWQTYRDNQKVVFRKIRNKIHSNGSNRRRRDHCRRNTASNIQKVKLRRVPGHDKITNHMMKTLTEEAILKLRELKSTIMRQR